MQRPDVVAAAEGVQPQGSGGIGSVTVQATPIIASGSKPWQGGRL